MDKSILIAEDEKPIAESLSFCLEKEGYKTYQAYDGQAALSKFKEKQPSLILLDLMLPMLSGQEVCKAIRRQSDTPIIMLTAKDSELDKIVGLEIGADDYITKPFSMRELIARINAVLRRSENISEGSYNAGDFILDEDRHEITFKNNSLNLPLKEYNILKTLILSKENVVSRKELIKKVWGNDFYGDEKTLDVHIRRLRKKFESPGDNYKHLRTVRGIGYRLLVEENGS